MKVCYRDNCELAGIKQPLENFYKRTKASDGYFTECKKCNNIRCENYKVKNLEKTKKRAENYRKENKEKIAAYYKTPQRKNVEFKNRYGITLDQRNKMASAQNGMCKICLTEPSRLVVDHCHKTGKIRGLLCDNCNKSLGLMKDNVTIILRMAEYLGE